MVIVRRNKKFIFDHYFNGKRLRHSFNTKDEAEAYKREFLLRQEGLLKSDAVTEQISLADAIRRYVESVTRLKGQLSITNEKRHFERLYDFLIDEKKLFWLQEIRLIHLEELRAKMRQSVSASTVNRHFNTYRHFFNKCERWNLLTRSPAKGYQHLPEDPEIRKPWTKEQMENVIADLPPWAGDVLFFIATATVRPGREVRCLTWGDVDFENESIRIKSYKGTGRARLRILPMSKTLLAFMASKREQARKAFRANEADLVFTNSLGNPVESNVVGRLVRRSCDKLGYKGLTPYGLRHTAFSELAQGNENLEKIRMLAGHSALTTTQRYLHLNVEQLREPIAKTSSQNLVRLVTNRSPMVTGKN